MKAKRNTKVIRPKPKKGGLLEYLDSLPKPKKVPKGNLVKLYFEDNKKKYGF